MKNLLIFGLNGSKNYAKKVASYLDVKLSNQVEQRFDDGESYIKSNVNVRNADVYVIAGLYSDEKQSINEKLVNLMWFVGSLRDASAGRITVVSPYLGYMRQDRKTESRAPITTKYMGQVIQSVGVDRILTIDVHSLAAFQNSFRIPADNLDTVRLFTDYLVGGEIEGTSVDCYHPTPLCNDPSNIVTLSPDIGGIPRMGALQTALQKRLNGLLKTDKIEVPFAVFDKRRVETESESLDEGERKTKVLGSQIIGNVKGKRVIIYDDMIATGTTIGKAAQAVEEAGGEVFAVCTAHGLFTGEAEKRLANVKKLVICDTVPPWRLNPSNWDGRLTVVSTTRLVAQAIKRTHEEGGSLSDLLTVS
jgi:ribose-phosphate pyrophosphokinase